MAANPRGTNQKLTAPFAFILLRSRRYDNGQMTSAGDGYPPSSTAIYNGDTGYYDDGYGYYDEQGGGRNGGRFVGNGPTNDVISYDRRYANDILTWRMPTRCYTSAFNPHTDPCVREQLNCLV
jgi:hypothetical protein